MPPAHWPAPPPDWQFYESLEEPEADAEAEAASEVEPEREPAAEPEREPTRESDPEPTPEAEPEPVFAPMPVLAPEPEPVPAPAPASEPVAADAPAPGSRRARRLAEREAAAAGSPGEVSAGTAPADDEASPDLPPGFTPLDALEELPERGMSKRELIGRLTEERGAWHDLAAELHRRLAEREWQLERLGALGVAELEARERTLAAEVEEWAAALDAVKAEIARVQEESDGRTRE
jgi:hypothetical protein